MCEVNRLVISPLISLYVRPSLLSKISRDKCQNHWRQTKLRTGQNVQKKNLTPEMFITIEAK